MDPYNAWSEVTSFADLFVRGASLHPDRDAVVFPNVRRTYAELFDGALTIARSLLALGFKKGDPVGFLAINSIEFIEGMVGASLLGCVVVPLNARHKVTELAYIIKDSELRGLFTTSAGNYADYAEVITQTLPELLSATDPTSLDLEDAPLLRFAGLLGGPSRPGFLGRDEFDLIGRSIDPDLIHQARRRVRIRDIAMVLYTSGTTANPKGCMLSHEALTRGPVERAAMRFSAAARNVTWGAGPLFHVGSLAPLIGSVGVVGTYVTDTFFDAGNALKLLYRENVTAAWPWFPAITAALIDHPEFDASKLESIKVILAVAPPALINRLQALFPDAEVIQACGMTETAGIFAINSRLDTPEERAVRQGIPEPGIDVRIVDVATGADLPYGTVGELLVRGYCLFEGYFRDPEKTATAMSNGWLRTGDLYVQSQDGSLTFKGRSKDMLKVGGENVAAVEIEAFLCDHPAVRMAEVVGKPDPRLDEVPVAFVELHAGSKLLESELIAFCRGKIASFKVPRAVFFVDPGGWPMSATKVDKRALRGRLSALQSDDMPRRAIG